MTYTGIKFPPLTSEEINKKYEETQEEMEEVLAWKKEEEDRLENGKTPQAKNSAKREMPKVMRRIDTVNGNLLYWKLRKAGKNHFHASLERNEYWDKLKNPEKKEKEERYDD